MSRSPLALTPEIDALRRQFEQIAADAEALIAPMRDDQFDWHPGPDSWSIAECFDHLNATARAYLPKLDEAIATAIRKGLYAEGPFRYGWPGRIYVWLMEPPPRIRMRTVPTFRPSTGRPRHEVMAALRAYQVQFIDRLRQANGLDLARARVSPPASKWLRMSLGAGFHLMAAHERRHVWQARHIAALPAFPNQSRSAAP